MASAIYSLFDANGDGVLSLEEVRALLRSVKGASIILYLELCRSIEPDEFGNRHMGGAIDMALALRAKYEALGVPGANLFPHLLASVNALDEDQSDSWQLSTAEFEALLKARQTKRCRRCATH